MVKHIIVLIERHIKTHIHVEWKSRGSSSEFGEIIKKNNNMMYMIELYITRTLLHSTGLLLYVGTFTSACPSAVPSSLLHSRTT